MTFTKVRTYYQLDDRNILKIEIHVLHELENTEVKWKWFKQEHYEEFLLSVRQLDYTDVLSENISSTKNSSIEFLTGQLLQIAYLFKPGENLPDSCLIPKEEFTEKGGNCSKLNLSKITLIASVCSNTCLPVDTQKNILQLQLRHCIGRDRTKELKINDFFKKTTEENNKRKLEVDFPNSEVEYRFRLDVEESQKTILQKTLNDIICDEALSSEPTNNISSAMEQSAENTAAKKNEHGSLISIPDKNYPSSTKCKPVFHVNEDFSSNTDSDYSLSPRPIFMSESSIGPNATGCKPSRSSHSEFYSTLCNSGKICPDAVIVHTMSEPYNENNVAEIHSKSDESDSKLNKVPTCGTISPYYKSNNNYKPNTSKYFKTVKINPVVKPNTLNFEPIVVHTKHGEELDEKLFQRKLTNLNSQEFCKSNTDKSVNYNLSPESMSNLDSDFIETSPVKKNQRKNVSKSRHKPTAKPSKLESCQMKLSKTDKLEKENPKLDSPQCHKLPFEKDVVTTNTKMSLSDCSSDDSDSLPDVLQCVTNAKKKNQSTRSNDTLPDSFETDSDIVRELRKVDDVHQLTENQLDYLLKANENYLRKIFSGKMYSSRHQKFAKGGLSRVRLLDEVFLSLYTDSQIDYVMTFLLGIFCKRNDKYHDYVFKVLLTESLIKIIMDFKLLNHEDAEKMLFEGRFKNIKVN